MDKYYYGSDCINSGKFIKKYLNSLLNLNRFKNHYMFIIILNSKFEKIYDFHTMYEQLPEIIEKISTLAEEEVKKISPLEDDDDDDDDEKEEKEEEEQFYCHVDIDHPNRLYPDNIKERISTLDLHLHQATKSTQKKSPILAGYFKMQYQFLLNLDPKLAKNYENAPWQEW